MIKLNKRVRKVLLPILLSGVIVVTAFGCQQRKIKELESQIQTKQVTTVTNMNKDAIISKFNEIRTYKVEDGKINFNHSYKYEDKAFLGFKKRINITAFADVYYQYNVDLQDASIIETEDKITILVPAAYLDKDTLHVEQDSIQYVESGTDSNIFTNKDDTREAHDEFIVSLEKEAGKRIQRYYNEESKKHIPYVTKKAVKKLVESFVHDKEIIVEVK